MIGQVGGKALFLSHSLSPCGDVTRETLEKGSFLASVRLQLAPACRASQKLGLQPQVLALRSEQPEQLQLLGNPKVCIVGKLSHPDPAYQYRIAIANLAALARLSRKGVPIGVVYSDNLADQASPVGIFYRDLISFAKVVICPSEAMLSYVRRWMKPGQHHVVIEDPVQVSRRSFQALDLSKPCRVIWFGHSSNLTYLLRELPGLMSKCDAAAGYELTVLSDPAACDKVKFLMANQSQRRSWSLRIVPWQLDRQPTQLEYELDRAHIALIPSDPKDPRKAAVSHNRLVDSLQAGCVVVANSVQSYKELAKVALIGENLPRLLDAAVADYQRLSNKYLYLRAEWLQRFEKKSNSRRWQECLSLVMA
jgi:hypothetical protein